MSLKIQQILHTIQGEGRFIGVPSLLIRLVGCNCYCDFCDSKETWKSSPENITIENYKDLEQEINKYKDLKIRNIIITGGEPLLHMRNLFFVKLFDKNTYGSWSTKDLLTFELETNGSLLHEFYEIIGNPIFPNCRIQFNISPKTNSNFYQSNFDYHHLFQNCIDIIKQYNQDTSLNSRGSIFAAAPILKFVDQHDDSKRNELDCFLKLLRTEIGLDYPIHMMPETESRINYNMNSKSERSEYIENFINASKSTLKYCLENGYIFIPRIHTYLFNDACEII